MGLNYVILNLKWSIISPNGGIIFTFGLFISAIILYLIFSKDFQMSLLHLKNKASVEIKDIDLKNSKAFLQELIMIFTIFLISGLLTTSMWWATFGWDTWGHRLIIPYAMPMIVLTVLGSQQYSEYYEKRMQENTETPFNASKQLLKSVSIIKWLFIILAIILALCGLVYNLMTVQAVYGKDLDVVGLSLHSQPWCLKMDSDTRGIAPYYWKCVVERFKYIPFFHNQERMIGLEAKQLIQIGIIAVFSSVILAPSWPIRKKEVAPLPRRITD